MEHTYFTLVARDSRNEAWTPQFGDFDLDCVREEAAEYRRMYDNGSSGGFKYVRIVRSKPSQEAIGAAISALNAHPRNGII